ncbi:type II toxin-antitoxin system YoeB family toxin [Blautia sp.]
MSLCYTESCKRSRRINEKDRLIYKIENSTLIIISCRYHY